MNREPKNHEPDPPSEWDLLEQLYFEGRSLELDARTQLLEPYRGTHPDLVEELEKLWRHKPHQDSLFNALPRISRSFWREFVEEKPPERVGPYEILEELGSGGMGVVYKALQPKPLSRQVAVKVLPAAFHGPTWRARFEMEQKTLSTMSHPHIATVHDAGVTPEGLPFLVMELLEGRPITQYCDGKGLAIPRRLDLFTQVCEGVSHAHRKGIIHRDLKPTNVMVIEQDGRPVPKIIDFGIAGSEDVTSPVAGGDALGTPAYMSPEQAAGQREKIDTRSDIYSLGALLFELLAGKPPLDARLRETPDFRDRCRVVASWPPEPLADQARKLVTRESAAARNTTSQRLIRELEGELDWILRKALAFDPEARYASCSELMDDLRRFQTNRPVLAVPGRTWYPLKKWFLSHKWLVGGAMTLIAALVLALIISLTSLRAVRASELHLREVHEFSESIFREVGPYYRGRDVKVIELLDDAARGIGQKYAGQPELERSIHEVLARSYHDLGLYAEAETHFARAAELSMAGGKAEDESTLSIIGDLAYNLFHAGGRARARELYRNAVAAAERRHGWKHPLTLKLSNGYAFVLARLGQVESARALFTSTLKQQRQLLGSTHSETLSTLNNFGDLLLESQEFARAEQLFTEALAAYREKKEQPDPYTATLMHNLAFAYLGQERYPEAIELSQAALKLREKMLGSQHPESLSTVNLLATAMGNSGSPRRAISLLQESLAGLPQRAITAPERLKLRHNLGHFLMIAGDLKSAEEVLRATWQERSDTLGPEDLDTLKTRFTLGEVLWASGRRVEAIAIFGEVVAAARHSLGNGHPYYKTFAGYWTAAKKDLQNP